MEWMESMLRNGAQSKPDVGDETVDDEDFYTEGVNGHAVTSTSTCNDALPGALQDGTASVSISTVATEDQLTLKPQYVDAASFNQVPNANPGACLSMTPTMTAQPVDARKLENQRKAEQLRAKLIANRQNTPNRANTPNKLTPKPEPRQESAIKKSMESTMAQSASNMDQQQSEPSSDIFGIEALLQEGKAAAEAKAQAEDSAKDFQSAASAPAMPAAEPQLAAVQQQHPQQIEAATTRPQELLTNVTDQLATEYYADLTIWLEVTGYHDIDYRNSKLRTYKERKALEEEAARIQERLEKLRQSEQAEMQALRSGSAHPMATPSRPPPALPPAIPATNGPNATAKSVVNGTKRPHSPELLMAEKNPRHRENADNGIRIRGANDSPQDRLSNNARARAGSPIDRRISYPEARRQGSFGESRGRLSRDPSLERRQAYYGRDGEGVRGRERFYPNHPPARDNAGRQRMGFSAVNVPQERAYREPYPAPPRGIRDVDTGRGANVRYIMIKSWNLDNVTNAMRDSLWSTQEKNEHLLADAYHNSHAVVLCFSVNNSKAFQGYALMASPPDPALPKPAFCSKLNWPTSPAFTLNWLATTPVHFRHVGHIKNPLNLDDSGHPCAVLVGKDGQEIEAEAGRRLCEILDEVMAGGEAGPPGGSGGFGGGGKHGGGKGNRW